MKSWIWRSIVGASLAVGLAGCGDDSEETDTADEATLPSEDEGSESEDGDIAGLGCAANIEHDTTDGNTQPIQETWGAACETDEDCVALIGEGGECMQTAVIYEVPLGYCTKSCSLPDDARVVENDPTCDPNGGVACVGAAGIFEKCAILCTDDDQCNRDGYTCRQMPQISSESDPSLCLMPDCCQDSCSEA